MNTQDLQGSFITLIWTLIAMVKDITNVDITKADSVPVHPRADMVANLLLQPMVSRSMHRELVEEARLSPRVYRFSSVANATPACWSGRSLKSSMR